jgi:hypothetical protein
MSSWWDQLLDERTLSAKPSARRQLLEARDEDGSPMPPAELRDEAKALAYFNGTATAP